MFPQGLKLGRLRRGRGVGTWVGLFQILQRSVKYKLIQAAFETAARASYQAA